MKTYPEKLIQAFLTEYRNEEIAKATGLHRSTVSKYKNDPDFQRALAQRRSELVGAAVDRMNAYMSENIDTLQGIIRSKDTSPQTKVNAIQVFLNQLNTWTTTTDILKRLEALEAAKADDNGIKWGVMA